jgi:hypothetical protein
MKKSIMEQCWKELADFKKGKLKRQRNSMALKMEEGQEIVPRLVGSLDKPSQIFRYADYKQPVKFLRDNIYKFHTGLSTPKNSPLSKLLKDNIQRLFESGIFKHVMKKYDYGESKWMMELFKLVEDPPMFVPLNLTMLQAGFVIWLCSVAVSIVVYIGEQIYFHTSKRIGKIEIKKFIKVKNKKKKVWANVSRWKTAKTLRKFRARTMKSKV